MAEVHLSVGAGSRELLRGADTEVPDMFLFSPSLCLMYPDDRVTAYFYLALTKQLSQKKMLKIVSENQSNMRN